MQDNPSDVVAAAFADLVSEPQYEDLLRRLLDAPAGLWHAATSLFEFTPRLRESIAVATLGARSGPFMMWLPDPLAGVREGYCLILCYWDDELACYPAVFNRAAFLAKIAERRARLRLDR